MEAMILVLIDAFGALVGPLLGAFATMVGGTVSSLFCAALDAVMLVINGVTKAPASARSTVAPPLSTHDRRQAASVPPAQPPPRMRWARRLLIASSTLTASVIVTLLVINQWFIDDLARWLLQRQQLRSGIVITAERIEGNLFSGSFHARGLTISRKDHPAGLIDLTVREVDATVAVWRVFTQPMVVEAIRVDGVHGHYERGVAGQPSVRKHDDPQETLSEQGTVSDSPDAAKVIAPRRHFTISALTISDVAVAYADHTRKRPLALALTIERLTAVPLRSQWAVFDVLFRANATGTIAGRPFRLATTGDDLERTTQWSAEGLPVTLLASQIGGPFALLSSGTCDIAVDDHWRTSDGQRLIVMDWKLVLNQVSAAAPENLSRTMALLAKPAVAFINAKGDRVPLAFTMEIDEDRFDGTASAEAAGLWQVVGDTFAATLGKELGIETDTLKAIGGSVLEKAKKALDQWRKK